MWSCGVMLYIMLAAAYPFGRPEDEKLKPSARMHAMLQVRPGLARPAYPSCQGRVCICFALAIAQQPPQHTWPW